MISVIIIIISHVFIIFQTSFMFLSSSKEWKKKGDDRDNSGNTSHNFKEYFYFGVKVFSFLSFLWMCFLFAILLEIKVF